MPKNKPFKQATRPTPKRGDLRVWHIPQIPGEAFRVPVPSVEQAVLVLNALANYDLFQLAHNIKPDYCNAQGLEVYDPEDDEGWLEWHCSDGMDISEHQRAGTTDFTKLVWEMDAE